MGQREIKRYSFYCFGYFYPASFFFKLEVFDLIEYVKNGGGEKEKKE